MATTTTNFGWDIPQSTDLVKDGATAIAALGQDIDTAFIDLKGGTTGQVLAKASNTDLDYSWVAQDDSNAIQNAIVDAKGDLISATAADTPARLAVGANDTVLTADSTTATGLKWAAPASGGGMTVLASGTLSGTALDLTSISASYTDLNLEITNANWGTADDYLILRFNGLSTGIYWTMSQGTVNGGGSSAFYGAGAASRMLLWTGTNWTRTGSNNINLTIPNYTATKRRTISGSIAGNVSGNDSLAYWQGFSTSTTAVNQITFSTNSGYTFSSGSYKLWGVK